MRRVILRQYWLLEPCAALSASVFVYVAAKVFIAGGASPVGRGESDECCNDHDLNRKDGVPG